MDIYHIKSQQYLEFHSNDGPDLLPKALHNHVRLISLCEIKTLKQHKL